MAAAPEIHGTGKVGLEVRRYYGCSVLGMSQGHLPIIIIHDKPSLTKQSQTLGEHSQLEVQENPCQGNTWEKFSPGRPAGQTEPGEGSEQGRTGLEIGHLFLPVIVQSLSHIRLFSTPWNAAQQLSHPLSPPSPPAFSLSQQKGLFQWIGPSIQVAKVLELQLQYQSF